MTSQFSGIDAVQVANNHIQTFDKNQGKENSVQSIQTAHRLRIVEEWLMKDNELNAALVQGNILDVGCGQGDQTGAIAAVLAKHSPSSHVYGIDPGPPEYGSPYTLAEAQKFICESELGSYVSFEKRGKTEDALARYPNGHFNTLTFSLCLWYFDDVQDIFQAFSSALKAGVKNLLIAEWSLQTSNLAKNEGSQAASLALPHLLAALIQAHAPLSDINVRILLSFDKIIEIANKAGWKVARQSTFSTDSKLHDGKWEVDMAVSAAEKWLKNPSNTSEKEILSIQSHLHTLKQSIPAEKNSIRCMDVWTCHFVPSG